MALSVQANWSKAGYMVTVVLSWLITLVVFIFVLIGAADNTGSTGVFNGTVAYLSEHPKSYIHIPRWSIATCIGFCYFDQFVFLLYTTSAIFRKSSDGTSLYQVAPFLHPLLFVFFMIGPVLRLIGLFVINSGNLVGSLVIQYVTIITLFTTLTLSIWGAVKYGTTLEEKGFNEERTRLVSLVHNSLATYPGWELIFSNARLAELLMTNGTLSVYTASAVGVGIFAGQFLILIVLELTVLEKYLRFVCSAPLLYIFVLMSMVIENKGQSGPIFAAEITLLVVSIVFLVVKIVVGVMRKKKDERGSLTSRSQPDSYGSDGETTLT